MDLIAIQQSILRDVMNGLSNKAIADKRRVKLRNVTHHISEILRKAECSTRAELLAQQYKQRIRRLEARSC
jgi:DNA-binding NarL/FixJ family response regulator